MVKRLDLGLAVIFLIDYAISFYTAEDRLKFYFNTGSLVDMLSIIPPFIYYIIPDAAPYGMYHVFIHRDKWIFQINSFHN